MLNKLLKYDLKYMIKNMSIFYILAIFFSIITRLLTLPDQSVMIGILYKISSGCVIAMIANIIINVMMRSWVRFRDSLYKDESYLTLSFIIILISLFIAYYSKDNWTIITNYIKTITIGLNMTTSFFISMAIIIIFLEIFNAIQCGFLGIILGHKMNNGKTGYSVLFGFIIYLIAQSIILFLVFIYGLFDPTIMELFKTATINIDVKAFKSLAIVSSLLYLVIIFVMSIICKKQLSKGVNIE